MTDGKDAKDVKSLPNLIQGKWEIPPNYMNDAFDGKNTMIPNYMNGSANGRNIISPASGYAETSYDSDLINEALITIGKSWSSTSKNRGDALRKLYEVSNSNKVFLRVVTEERLLPLMAALPQGDLVQLLQVIKSFSDNP